MRARTLDAETRSLAEQMRSAVLEVEPEAQVILYGSRARGDAAPDSDWDLLVLVDGPVDHQREQTIGRRLFEFELETDTIISVIVYSKEDWGTSLYRAMPFHKNVTREGTVI
jgi:uncharacterized protein